MPVQSLGARLAHNLKARGVDTIFGIPGVHNVELYRGIEEAGITHILARHEQGAGFMADGYARASGQPGIAFTISGPGLTNIMTPMGQAYSDSVPLLVISSCLPEGPAMPGRLHQMRDQAGAAATVCDWSLCASDAQMAFDLLDRAFEEFQNLRPRPKHITIPLDVLDELGKSVPPIAINPISHEPDPQQIIDLAQLLERANYPVFVFGGGAIGAKTYAREVVKNTGAAVFMTYAGRGIVQAEYPINFGASLLRPDSAKIFAMADLVVAIGTELAEVDLWRDNLGHSCQMVRVDIEDLVLHDPHAANVTIKADASATLKALAGALKPSKSDWQVTDVSKATAAFHAETDGERPGIVPFVNAMSEALPKDALIYSDMTQFAYVAKEIYPLQEPGLWHHPYGFGTLGYALPAAIGGKIACPDRCVLAIAGDYGFQYTMQELGVAAELELSLPIILWDNGKLKEIEDAMVKSQIAPNAVVAKNPDFGLLARAYGIGYLAPENPASFALALQEALTTSGPVLIHISP